MGMMDTVVMEIVNMVDMGMAKAMARGFLSMGRLPGEVVARGLKGRWRGRLDRGMLGVS